MEELVALHEVERVEDLMEVLEVDDAAEARDRGVDAQEVLVGELLDDVRRLLGGEIRRRDADLRRGEARRDAVRCGEARRGEVR